MKAFISIFLFSFVAFMSQAQNKNTTIHTVDPAKPIQVVEAACGECQFGMQGKSCGLAVRINGKAYFAEGTSIDDHGDAHSKNGFCNATRKAEVQGEIKDNTFAVTYFKLLDSQPAKKKGKKVN